MAEEEQKETPEQKRHKENKASLKREGQRTLDYARAIGAHAPIGGGMSIADFKSKYIPGFQTGWTELTKEQDTAYNFGEKRGPKIKILSEGGELPRT
jgi:hypothetical protein